MRQGFSLNLQALEQRLAQFGRFAEGPPPQSPNGNRRDAIGDHPIVRMLHASLGEVLPGARILDWEVQPSGVVGRAEADRLVYRFRADSHAITYRPAWDGLNEAQWEARSDGFLAARDPQARAQHRQDFRGVRFQQKRTKRQCSRGYGCGAACIAMGKECRITPSSALSKQRLRQLQVLAREGNPRMQALEAQVQGARNQQAGVLREERQVNTLRQMLQDPKVAAMVRSGRVPDSTSQTSGPKAPLAGTVQVVAPGQIEVDPKRFQYKIVSNAAGEVGSLRDVRKWDDNLAGVISVWQDPGDGKTYVVNGHNRLGLAKRQGVDGVTVRYLKAANAKEARAIGALQNIAEGQGTEVDAAKFFRDSGIRSREDVEARGLPLTSGKAARGLALAGLPREMFDRVVQGDLSVGRGAIIGGSGLDAAKQREIGKLLKARPSVSDGTLGEYVEALAASQRQRQKSLDLFGSTEEVDTGLARAELVNGITRKIGRERRLFSMVSGSKAAATLQEKAGNQINREASGDVASTADRLGRMFKDMKNVSGPMSTAINRAAARVTAGEKRDKVQRDLYEDVVAAMRLELERAGLAPKPATREAATASMFDSSAPTGMALLEVLEDRMDAMRRKCTTGYGCGSSCISVQKECRARPSSAIGKERLKRLGQLARGEIQPRGIGVPSPAKAAAMAEGLRGARGTKSQELIGQRNAAKAAREAAAAEQAAKDKAIAAGSPSRARKGNPRAEAETVEGSGDYEFARKSTIQNAGEDIALSARHRRNMFRTIEEAEASGQVEKLLARDNLLKNFPTDLISGINAGNVLTRLEGHYCLKAFPNLSAKEVASYAAIAEARRLRGETTRGAGSAMTMAIDYEEGDAKTVRKQYFEAFQKVRQYIEDNKDLAPGLLRESLQREVHKMIKALRKSQGDGLYAADADPHNPVANSMVDFYNRLHMGGKATVYGQMNEFTKAFMTAGKYDKGDARGTLERSIEPATKIMEGASLNEAFGRKGADGKWRFSAADRYVGHALREGGQKVGGTPQAATDTIVKGLGFRGLQYGNSVTDEERKHHVQKAAEALVDLADAIGLPDKAIGLNGTLGLAIGARGRGSAVAHYEPGLKVINLTRKNGVGSLSHEWGHALDNYVAGGFDGFLSDGWGKPEKRAAMKEVMKSWKTSGYRRQCLETIWAIKKAGGMISEDYWLSNVELFARSFESHVSLKLAKEGRSNTYLTRELHESGMNKGNKDPRAGDGLWPSRQQAEAMEPMFDALIARLRQDDFPGQTNRNDSRYERIYRFMHAMAG